MTIHTKLTILALSAFLSLITLLPAATAWPEALAEANANLREGNDDDARAIVEAYLAKTESEAEKAYFAGVLALAAGETESSVKQLKAAIKTDPEVAAYHARLGSSLIKRADEVNFFRKMGIYGEALGAYQKAVEVDPANIEGRMGLIYYYVYAPAIGGGSKEKAALEAKTLQEHHRWLGTEMLAFVYKQEDKLAEAVATYQTYLADHPEHVRAWLNLTKTQTQNGDHTGAKASLAKAMALEPANEEAQTILSELE